MRKIIKFIAICGFILPFLAPGFVYAQDSNDQTSTQQNFVENIVQLDDCYSLDLIFLIDQSGSMSGDDGNPNDPLGNRFQAPRYAMDWLANNRLGRCPKAVHRISVISFGTNVKINLPLTIINPSSQTEWDQSKNKLENQIEELRMGTTDPLIALKEADQILNNAPRLGEIERKRVVILLTDGQPCVEHLGCSYGNDKMDHDAYMDQLTDFVSEKFPFAEGLFKREIAIKEANEKYGSIDNIPEDIGNNLLIDNPVTQNDMDSSVYIWVIAMNAQSNYLKTDGVYWTNLAESHAGELIKLRENAIEVPTVFNEIMSSLQGITPELLGCGDLVIDPYLSGAILDIFKGAEGLDVFISFNDKKISEGKGDIEYFGVKQYDPFGAIEHYRFEQPPAGVWKVDASVCSGIKASYTPFKPEIKYLSPGNYVPEYHQNGLGSDPDDPYKIQVQITDVNFLKPLNMDPNYPLTLTATVTSDSLETPKVLPMVFKQDGIWESTEPIPVNGLGNYKIQITGTTKCILNEKKNDSRCKGGTLEVVNDNSGAYTTIKTALYRMKIISPTENVMNLHAPLIPGKLEIIPILVQVNLEDESGNPLDWKAVIKNSPENAIEGTLEAGSTSKSIFLIPSSTETGQFYGTFNSPAVLGPQKITIKMVGETYKDKYQLAQNPVEIMFDREDPLLSNINFYYALIGLLILALIGSIAKIIWDRSNFVVGSLEFTSMDESKTLKLNKRRRVSVFKSGFPTNIGIKKIEIKNQGTVAGKSRIELSIFPVTKGKVKVDHLVDSNPPTPLSGFWNIQYISGKNNSDEYIHRPNKRKGR